MHLSHPIFLELSRQAEEYGFSAAPGPIMLPCDEDRFVGVLHHVSFSAAKGRWCNPRGGEDGRRMVVEESVLATPPWR
jgi:SAUR family protein